VPAHCVSEDEVIGIARDADAVIAEYAPLTRRVIEQLEHCKIIAFDPYVSDDIFKRKEVNHVTFEAILVESDFISINLPRTPETINLISQKELSLMKNTGCATGRSAM
jgi:D-3-phosphoglycerate dehydrogenase